MTINSLAELCGCIAVIIATILLVAIFIAGAYASIMIFLDNVKEHKEEKRREKCLKEYIDKKRREKNDT